ncbi:unnamed protein product [Prorocentrum cordatum]|uniref:Uncharacterized protein n=1 Tax=Prorocentrum cordatum TaxID=2364126 RepID=A0ABN9WIH2_9DINO|nr:unnamed protein product [Polarella glacialis]
MWRPVILAIASLNLAAMGGVLYAVLAPGPHPGRPAPSLRRAVEKTDAQSPRQPDKEALAAAAAPSGSYEMLAEAGGSGPSQPRRGRAAPRGDGANLTSSRWVRAA